MENHLAFYYILLYGATGPVNLLAPRSTPYNVFLIRFSNFNYQFCLNFYAELVDPAGQLKKDDIHTGNMKTSMFFLFRQMYYCHYFLN